MAIQQDRQKISSRYATLSPNLRALLFSAQTAEIVRVACESNHLPLEKNPGVAKIVGLVFFGFIHPEDLAGELEGGASIPAQTAINIADSLNKKLFAPIKSDLEKIYAPLPHEHEIATGPKILQEIRPAPQIISQAVGGGGPKPTMSAVPSPAPPPPTSTPAPKPPLTGVGWSKSTAENPVVKLSQTSPSVPQPTPMQKIAPAAPRPMPSEIKSSIGEFERIAIQQGGKNVPPPPPKPSAASIPAPIIIHEDAAFRAAPQPSDFRLQLPPEKFGSRGPSVPPPKTAILELGKAAPTPGVPVAPKPPAPSSTPRVVHYSEYKPPASITPPAGAPSAPQGPRQITEVTAAPVPKPAPVSMPTPMPAIKPSVSPPPISATPKPPAASQPPRPAMPPPPPPPATPQNKVVYKDYTEPPKPPSPGSH